MRFWACRIAEAKPARERVVPEVQVRKTEGWPGSSQVYSFQGLCVGLLGMGLAGWGGGFLASWLAHSGGATVWVVRE